MDLRRLTADLQRRIFGVPVDELRKQVASLRNELADLKVDLNRLSAEVRKLREELDRSGRERPLEDRTLDEILALHKGCREVLERFDIAGGGTRTLREAASEAEAEVETIVATIKNLMKDRSEAA